MTLCSPGGSFQSWSQRFLRWWLRTTVCCFPEHMAQFLLQRKANIAAVFCLGDLWPSGLCCQPVQSLGHEPPPSFQIRHCALRFTAVQSLHVCPGLFCSHSSVFGNSKTLARFFKVLFYSDWIPVRLINTTRNMAAWFWINGSLLRGGFMFKVNIEACTCCFSSGRCRNSFSDVLKWDVRNVLLILRFRVTADITRCERKRCQVSLFIFRHQSCCRRRALLDHSFSNFKSGGSYAFFRFLVYPFGTLLS